MTVLLTHQAYAQAVEKAKELETIYIKGRRNINGQTVVERKNRKILDQEMVRDVKDLVRYSSDVGISDNGRHIKGFAMRGVEGNRVGISIDGVNLPDSEENSLYARYGNFNNSRLSIDSELVRGIDVVKGSDALNSGSGSLGGTVNYRTLDAQDIVSKADKNIGALLKSGWSSKNREWLNTLGLGFIGDNFDGVLLYSHRYGHETKSRGGDIVPFVGYSDKDKRDNAERGAARIYPDPAEHKNNSFLAKINWQFLPNHRIGFSVNGQNNSNFTDEKSYSLTTYWRKADDKQKRINSNLFYEWQPENGILSKFKQDFDYQKTENAAVNYKGDMQQVGGDWRNGYIYAPGEVTHLDNRNNKTKFLRTTSRFDFKPFEFAGSHKLSLKLFTSTRNFENINQDDTFNQGTRTARDIYTIQRPMKTTQYGFSVLDNIAWNDWLSGRIGVRYDHEKITPKSLRSGVPCGKQSFSFGRVCSDTNPRSSTFNNWNGNLGLDMKINNNWNVGYDIGTGYRVPTASELNFTFESPYGNWKSNPNLKAERSINQTINLQGKGKIGTLDLSLYNTRYRKFLFEQETTALVDDPLCTDPIISGCKQKRTEYYQQMVNIDKAKISGLEFKGALNLNAITPHAKGWKLSGALGYSTGKLSISDSLMSIQPLKAVVGLDYEQPEGKWGILSRLTYTANKKAKDAKYSELADRCVKQEWDDWFQDYICKQSETYTKKETYKWLNKSAWVFDVFGYYKPFENLTLRAGVYNVFNRKYHTWDSLRGINRRATVNSIDWDKGQGLERFYAPGRNFAVSLEYKF